MWTRRTRMIVTAKIEKLENGKLVLKPDVDISRFLAQKRPRRVEVRLDEPFPQTSAARFSLLSEIFLCGQGRSRKNFGFIWNGISVPAVCGSGSPFRIAI